MAKGKAKNGKNGGNGNKVDPESRWAPSRKFLNWIRAYRVYRLAKRIRCDRWNIYRWMRGDRPPGPAFAQRIIAASKEEPCGVGGLSLEDIYGQVEAESK